MKLIDVQLRDFRAFPGNFDLKLPCGCNLLVHGENGSGKSSLALALREFIALDRPLPRPIEPHVHAFPNSTPGALRQPAIILTFEDTSGTDTLHWQAGQSHPLDIGDTATPSATTPAQRQKLVAVARQSGFYDYRALLRTSYRNRDASLAKELFILFVENLLGTFPLVPGGADTVRQAWEKVRQTKPLNRWPRRIREANLNANPLNKALAGFLDTIRVETNRLLTTYFPNQRLVLVSLATPGCRFDKTSKDLTGTSILPEIEYNGLKVRNHEDFLNEARLTALGLSLFLAALKLADSDPRDPEPLRLLVLDDVLIGLDMSNRLPLLELLRVEFPYHQILLLTHDELWFNIAREHSQHWGNWRSVEMFAELTGPSDPPIPRLKDVTDDLAVATSYLNTNELRPAAVYVRAAFESRLRHVCEDKHIKLDFRQDPKKVTADMLWTALLARHNELTSKSRPLLDPALIPGIEAVRSQVLNRLLHDGGIGLTRPDVQAAISSIRTFRSRPIPFVA